MSEPSNPSGDAPDTAGPLAGLQGLPLHTRSLTVAISRASDSLWRARGDVIDLRKTGFVTTHHDIQPSGIIHSMNITLDFDPATMRIESVAVDQPHIAFDPSPESGGECCRDPAPRLVDFEGDHLDPGFTKRLGAKFGGPLGCSHLLTLFQLMASTVPLGVAEEQQRAAREHKEARHYGPFFRRNLFIDGHLRGDNRIDCGIQLADTHTRPIEPGEAFVKQLESSHEWKLLATVDRKRFLIDSLSAKERFRRSNTLSSAAWEDHSALVSELAGSPILPGLAGRIFRLLPEAASSSSLRDSLLQLAPGFLQVIAALMDETTRERAENAKEAGDADTASANVFGGSSNSCYMWRTGSPISQPYEDKRSAASD